MEKSEFRILPFFSIPPLARHSVQNQILVASLLSCSSHYHHHHSVWMDSCKLCAGTTCLTTSFISCCSEFPCFLPIDVKVNSAVCSLETHGNDVLSVSFEDQQMIRIGRINYYPFSPILSLNTASGVSVASQKLIHEIKHLVTLSQLAIRFLSVSPSFLLPLILAGMSLLIKEAAHKLCFKLCFLKHLFSYFWLSWVFIAVLTFLQLWCKGFSLQCFSCCGTWVLDHGLQQFCCTDLILQHVGTSLIMD